MGRAKKHKHAILQGHIEALPFRYELDAALEVIIQLIEDDFRWRIRGYSFSAKVSPMHPDRLEHKFVLSLPSSGKANYAEGRIFQVSETSCVVEGTMYLDVVRTPRYKTVLKAILLGLTLLVPGLYLASLGINAPCISVVILGVFCLNVTQPATDTDTKRDDLLRIFRNLEQMVRALPDPYTLAIEPPWDSASQRKKAH